ncbi:MAG: hypothetical protein MPF33_07755 [Candidatus Aramenus sp.]|nr:hypothetical protein [Candidatus Aramenus sp.]
MSSRKASLVFIALSLCLATLVTGVQSFSIPQFPTTTTHCYSTLSFPSNLTYYIVVSNTTKVPTTNTSTTNTSTSNVLPSRVVNYTYVAHYQVVKYSSEGQLTVNLTVENTSQVAKGFNFTLLKTGLHNVSLEEDPLNLNYPFVFPGYLFNNTYTLSTPSNSLTLVYDGVANETILGVKYVVIKYFFGGSQASGVVYITENGTVTYVNTTYNGLNVQFFLKSSQGTTTVDIPNTATLPSYFLNRSYLYAIYEYSNYSDSLQSVGDEEIVYPFVFPNGIIGETAYQVNTVSGSPLVNFNDFTIHIGNYTSLETSFYPYLTQEIEWNSESLTMVGRHNVTIFGVNYPNAYVYEGNQSVKNSTVVHEVVFSPSGILIDQVASVVHNGVSTQEFEAKYVGNIFYNNSETYPNFQTFSDTNLPFSVVSPSTSLTVAIIVTIAIVAILVLLHRRD